MERVDYEERPLLNAAGVSSSSSRLHATTPLHKRLIMRAKLLTPLQICILLLVAVGAIYGISRFFYRLDRPPVIRPPVIDPSTILTFSACAPRNDGDDGFVIEEAEVRCTTDDGATEVAAGENAPSGTVCTVVCSAGYGFEDVDVQNVTCGDDGVWSSAPVCADDRPRVIDPSTILTFSDEEFGKFCSRAKSESDVTPVSNVPDTVASCLARLPHATPSDEVRSLIRAEQKKYGFQQTIDERALLYEGFRCFNFSMNLLVWGTGRDSTWFAELNKGKTRFLENLPDWLDNGNEQLSKLDRDARIIKIEFHTLLRWENSYLRDMNALMVALPDEIWETRWDYIIVDSPWGFTLRGPGRMSSIATTRFLHQCHGLEAPYTPQVATVHDVEREAEKTWGEAVFGRPLQCWQAMCLWKV